MSMAKQIYYNNLRQNIKNMTPKLQQLAVESGAYIDGDTLICSAMDPSTFARLIIDQCISIVEQAAEQDPALYGVALELQDYWDL